jgi:hypothetical protein
MTAASSAYTSSHDGNFACYGRNAFSAITPPPVKVSTCLPAAELTDSLCLDFQYNIVTRGSRRPKMATLNMWSINYNA